jgi:FkbM family methyltransferase
MKNPTLAPALCAPKDTRFRRRKRYLLHLLKRALMIRRGYRLCTLGEESSGCAYTFCPDGLGPECVVYSGGVGKDISFEHALAKKFGCRVLLFDPSPIGLETMKLPENKISNFRFFPVGLAGQSGTLRLAPPFTPEGDSWFSANSGTIEVSCLDLAALMKKNQHQFVDLLKIDIEGAEYGVIDHIVKERIRVRQILVEFHDGILPGIRLSQSLRATFKLLAHGYKLVSEVGGVDTFVQGRTWNHW